MENFCPFFKPAQAVQNFTIKHTYLKKGQLENLIFFKISTVKKWIFFFDINFVWKICSFEVNFVNVPQKLREGQGCIFSKICNIVTLNGLGRVKERIKIFIFLFSVMLLTQRIRKSCPQSEIFNLRGKCIFGTVY